MTFTDQIGHTFKLETFPKRIISVVPSQTELLYDLGLETEVVGVTKFCIHPNEWFKTKNRVGGTKTLNFDKIAELEPDLIIANKEENTQSEIEALQKVYPVYTSDISNLSKSLAMIKDIGIVTNTEAKAVSIIEKIELEFEKLSKLTFPTKRTLYLIWKNPYMTINKNTFINNMMNHIGLHNVMDTVSEYPEVSRKEISVINPELILLSSEPFPFKEEHIAEFQNICPNAQIKLVDGEYFSWYGSRLLGSPDYFIDLLG